MKNKMAEILLIGLICWKGITTACAIEPSPAGGGYLRFPGEMAFGLVEHSPDLFQDVEGGITIDGWIFFEKFPANMQALMLLQKPEGFQFVIQGTTESGRLQALGPSRWRQKDGRRSGGGGGGPVVSDLKTNTWYYFHCHFQAKYEELMDNLNLPLAIGAKCFHFDLLEEHHRPMHKLVLDYIPFVGGLDELRISNTLRSPFLRGSQKVFLGDSPPEGEYWEIPKKGFTPDENTIVLWHFDDPKHLFTDAINGLEIRPYGTLKAGQAVEQNRKEGDSNDG